MRLLPSATHTGAHTHLQNNLQTEVTETHGIPTFDKGHTACIKGDIVMTMAKLFIKHIIEHIN